VPDTDPELVAALNRIATALEADNDWRRHSCGRCEGTGMVLVTYDLRDSAGMQRDLTQLKGIVPQPSQVEVDYVLVRQVCINCDGTGRIVPKRYRRLPGCPAGTE
jgi:RecJ-like exonuclease